MDAKETLSLVCGRYTSLGDLLPYVSQSKAGTDF